jgi:UDP-glucose 4-epimerase
MSAGRALVLGSAGFIGRHVSRALVRDGWRVRGFDRRPAGAWPGSEAIECRHGDFDDKRAVAAALEHCDTVFHLISTTLPETSNHSFDYDLASNVAPTLRFLDLAVRQGVRRVVFASSGGTVYGTPDVLPIPETHATEPRCAYGVHKLTIEKYLALYRVHAGLDYRVLRIANAFGEGQPLGRNQGAVVTFLDNAMRDEPLVIWGDGTTVRDYVHVEDVARAFSRAGEDTSPHTVFNIGTGTGVSLLRLVEVIESMLGRPVARRHVPCRRFDVGENVLDISRAAASLCWQPEISFTEGVRRTLTWLATARPADVPGAWA